MTKEHTERTGPVQVRFWKVALMSLKLKRGQLELLVLKHDLCAEDIVCSQSAAPVCGEFIDLFLHLENLSLPFSLLHCP